MVVLVIVLIYFPQLQFLIEQALGGPSLPLTPTNPAMDHCELPIGVPTDPRPQMHFRNILKPGIASVGNVFCSFSGDKIGVNQAEFVLKVFKSPFPGV